MKEIRFHGRGGQGVVKAAQILVETIIESNRYAQFIPFFGVERKGSPVYGFVRIDDKPIRVKSQVYDPHCIMVLDDTLLEVVPVFSGLRGDGIVALNSTRSLEQLNIPDTVKKLVVVDATKIALDIIKKDIPNTAMLGAFAKATKLVDTSILYDKISRTFGKKNAEAALLAYENSKIYNFSGGSYSE